ncbi:hypothetical protein K501DRAFT_169958 [Backusella circina FSU 941]|nr:hypothetical protein K501DRAFT_169958 [Backusella circina FSU 941]
MNSNSSNNSSTSSNNSGGSRTEGERASDNKNNKKAPTSPPPPLPPLSSQTQTLSSSNSSDSQSKKSNSSSSSSLASHSYKPTTHKTTTSINTHNTTIITTTNINNNTIIHHLHASDIIHDANYCMFKVSLDKNGATAALCYLPTRFQHIVEFYHTEIPIKYRHCGLGDLLLHRALQWAQSSNKLVIPTCPFVKSYLEARFNDQNGDPILCVVTSEQEGMERLSKAPL